MSQWLSVYHMWQIITCPSPVCVQIYVMTLKIILMQSTVLCYFTPLFLPCDSLCLYMYGCFISESAECTGAGGGHSEDSNRCSHCQTQQPLHAACTLWPGHTIVTQNGDSAKLGYSTLNVTRTSNIHRISYYL